MPWPLGPEGQRGSGEADVQYLGVEFHKGGDGDISVLQPQLHPPPSIIWKWDDRKGGEPVVETDQTLKKTQVVAALEQACG